MTTSRPVRVTSALQWYVFHKFRSMVLYYIVYLLFYHVIIKISSPVAFEGRQAAETPGLMKCISQRKKLRFCVLQIYTFILPTWSNTHPCPWTPGKHGYSYFPHILLCGFTKWQNAETIPYHPPHCKIYPIFSVKEYFFLAGWFSVMKFTPLLCAGRTSQISSSKICAFVPESTGKEDLQDPTDLVLYFPDAQTTGKQQDQNIS